jgi:hypothetical protein
VKLISVSLHLDTVAMLAATANTELDSANNAALFFGRTNRRESAENARRRAEAWATSAANLNITAKRIEDNG